MEREARERAEDNDKGFGRAREMGKGRGWATGNGGA